MISREQFMAAAGAFYDMLNAGSAPTAGFGGTGDGRPPNFDTKILRKGGMIQWASECSLKELSYWREQANKPSDPKYADSNARQARALDYWIAFRRREPGATWTGERNRVTVTAKPPSDKPAQYPKDAPAEPAGPPPDYGFDEPGDDSFDTDSFDN